MMITRTIAIMIGVCLVGCGAGADDPTWDNSGGKGGLSNVSEDSIVVERYGMTISSSNPAITIPLYSGGDQVLVTATVTARTERVMGFLVWKDGRLSAPMEMATANSYSIVEEFASSAGPIAIFVVGLRDEAGTLPDEPETVGVRATVDLL